MQEATTNMTKKKKHEAGKVAMTDPEINLSAQENARKSGGGSEGVLSDNDR